MNKIDPFAYWPERPSAILLAHDTAPTSTDGSGYVLHTRYIYPRAGETRFELEVEGLEATEGRLVVEVFALEVGATEPTLVARERRALSEMAAGGGVISLGFRSRPDTAYALYGWLDGAERARASALAVRMDEPEDGVRRLEASRRAVFGRRSRVGSRRWYEAPALERAGLLSTQTATLADPISQMCTAAQFEEPAFARWIDALALAPARHRKLWEFAYVLQVLEDAGVLRPGARGLGFGVGSERLPSLFAARGIDVTATDLPAGEAAAAVWAQSGQHSDSLSRLHVPELCSREAFDRHVTFRAVDMTDIPDDLQGYDFCWSACAYEHLGSIGAGLDFFRESVRRLKPGGVAVHTTELNLTSDDATLESGMVVLFRRSDMEQLALALHGDGHEVRPITYDQGDRPIDRHVDLPPYANDPHLKLLLESFVTTSFGLACRRGA